MTKVIEFSDEPQQPPVVAEIFQTLLTNICLHCMDGDINHKIIQNIGYQ